ncbi:MAG: M15 family metallopeptidase [Bauldia sp.]|nr:M15 family metallopeptidase [Bauldia sp.]
MNASISATAQTAFTGTAEPLPEAVIERMLASGSWQEGCPVALADLRYLRLGFIDFSGAVQEGEMVVAADVADAIVGVFRTLFEAGFPLERMQLVDDFAAADDLSMAANNTSAFNCRAVTGGTGYSQHSYGNAIDISPIQNPYVRVRDSGTLILPPEGAAFADRADVRPGMIVAGDVVTAAFADIGWVWGGDWTSLKDYQHFSANGQ